VAIDNEEKTKLRESIANGYKRDEIELIAKNSSGEDRFSLNKEMRVCAYCRVSTDNIEQTTSYEFQRQEYTEKIESNDKWTLVDIYR
jgi:site-specific DNA recombinase